jgi:hypothetical protein
MRWPHKKTSYQALVVVGILFAFAMVLTCGFIQWFGHDAGADSSGFPGVCLASSAFGLTKLSEDNLALVVLVFSLVFSSAVALAVHSSPRIGLFRHRGLLTHFQRSVLSVTTSLEEGFRRGILQPQLYSLSSIA